MKTLLATLSVLFIVSCSKKDTAETNSTTDSLPVDTMTAIPNPSPSTDTTSVSVADSTSASSSMRKDSAK